MTGLDLSVQCETQTRPSRNCLWFHRDPSQEVWTMQSITRLLVLSTAVYFCSPWGCVPGRLAGIHSCRCRCLQRHCSGRHCAGFASSAGQSSCLWSLRMQRTLFLEAKSVVRDDEQQREDAGHLWSLLPATPARRWWKSPGSPSTPGSAGHPGRWSNWWRHTWYVALKTVWSSLMFWTRNNSRLMLWVFLEVDPHF